MELIKINYNDKNEQLISARELYEFLGSKQDFTTWIKGRIAKYGFVEDEDFTLHKFMEGKNWKHDYILKIDMAKELSMVENNERGRQARKYFIACEKALQVKQDSYMIEDPIERAKRWIEEQEERNRLAQKIEQDKPLVEFANQVSNNSDLILVREFAKLLADENIKIGEKRLYQWFRDNGFILKDKTEPTQKSVEQGLFKIIERVVKTPYGDKLTRTTKVTGKGQIYFTEKLRRGF